MRVMKGAVDAETERKRASKYGKRVWERKGRGRKIGEGDEGLCLEGGKLGYALVGLRDAYTLSRLNRLHRMFPIDSQAARIYHVTKTAFGMAGECIQGRSDAEISIGDSCSLLRLRLYAIRRACSSPTS